MRRLTVEPYAPAMDAQRQPEPVGSMLLALALLLLAASSLVLATSWTIGYPAVVLATGWTVAVIALITVGVTAWRDTRSTGVGFLPALGSSLKRVGRFVIDFF